MKRAADDDIIVLDSVGSPALCFAVPATLRLIESQLDNIRQARPQLAVITGESYESADIAKSRPISTHRPDPLN